MGNWAIVVRGTGSHHNKRYPKDANRAAAEFVQRLKADGHSIVEASFTYGAADDLSVPDVYLANRDEAEKEKP